MQHTKACVQWLVNRAERLYSQKRNVSDWRLGLENDVLRRFGVEVALRILLLKPLIKGSLMPMQLLEYQ